VGSSRILVPLAAATVVGALTLPVSAGASTATSAAVATGTVIASSGAAMPGATVDLYAWPSDAVLRAMKVGSAVPTTLLGTVTTNKAGRYTMRVTATKLKAASVESGYANLEIYSPEGGLWFFPYQTGGLPAQAAAPVTVNLGSKTSKPSCGKAPAGQEYGLTSFTKLNNGKPAWAIVGQGYIVKAKQTGGDTVAFEYTQGSSHSQGTTLGLGISGYGLFAGYKTGGTDVSTAHRTAGFPTKFGNSLFRTEFSTATYRAECVGLVKDRKTVFQEQKNYCPRTITEPKTGYKVDVHKCFWEVRSTGWFTGTNLLYPKYAPATPGGNCSQWVAGSSFDTDFGTAENWSSGFDLGATVGIKGANLRASFGSSAQTGYDANAYMDFTFHKNGWMCGTNASPGTAALLVLRPFRP
jgi:hypothetical protein